MRTGDRVRLTIDEELARLAPTLCVGVGVVEGVVVRAHDARLWSELETIADEVVAVCGVNPLADDPPVRAVRAVYRALGVDPTRYRPASEALIRRLLQGKGIDSINTVVDVNNMASIATRVPWGVYDRAQIDGEMVLRVGRDGERYDGIGKPNLDAAGKLVLADARGPFGSPSADAVRTQVGLGTRDLVIVMFAAEMPAETVERAMNEALARMVRYNGGEVAARAVVEGRAVARGD